MTQVVRNTAVALVFTLLASSCACAEYALVVIERPFHARSLSGITFDPSGAPLPGTEVRDYDESFTHVLASTTSDGKGQFSLPSQGRSLHHVQFTARGMNPLRITVELRTFAPSRIKVRLPIGG